MDRRVRHIVAVLESEWRTPLSLCELGRRVNLGASRLEHLFKVHAKVTIREFVRERRLAAAADLLRSTEERVSAISYLVGFGDVSNFNHAFKRRFGVSPRAYRERAANGDWDFHQENREPTK